MSSETVLETVSASAILGDAFMTILIGIVVVFCVLLLLTGIFKLFGLLMSKWVKEEPVTEEAPVVRASVPAEAVGNTSPVTTKPDVQNGVPEETVAAISAAVASMAPAGVQYAVTKIEKCKEVQ